MRVLGQLGVLGLLGLAAASPTPYLNVPTALPNTGFGQLVALAPLTRGGTPPFRALCAALGASVCYGEMATSRVIDRGRDRKELAKLRKSPGDSTFIAQIAAKSIAEGTAAIQVAKAGGADAVDLNCGCPTYDVLRRGLGASLLRKPKKLERLVGGLAEAAAEVDLPLSVKIRAGFEGEPSLEFTLDLVRRLQDAGAAAVAIHGRTAEQRYLRNADWDLIRRVAADPDIRIPILGNGDALAWWELRELLHSENEAAQGWGGDGSRGAGVLVGRGALIKPWIFREASLDADWEPSQWERVAIYLQLALNMAVYFRPDERGRSGAFYFLPWHLDFFCRHRPTPVALRDFFQDEDPQARRLIQSGREIDAGLRTMGLGPADMSSAERQVDRALRHPGNATHAAIAAVLWDEAVAYLNEAVPGLRGTPCNDPEAFAEMVPMEDHVHAFLPFREMPEAARAAVDRAVARVQDIGVALETAAGTAGSALEAEGDPEVASYEVQYNV